MYTETLDGLFMGVETPVKGPMTRKIFFRLNVSS